MRAARLHSIGGTLQLDEVAEPVAGDGEVVVELAYASVNPLDIWITRGAPGSAAANLPWVPGTEASGHLDGTAVIVRGAGLGIVRAGLYRQRAAVPAGCVRTVPDGVDLVQAAAIGVAGVTAWQCVNKLGRITADDRVLLMGASGGVGALATQLAAATGATVWGQTTNAAKTEGIMANGAAHAVVTEAGGLAAAVATLEPTVVLDPLGGPFTDAAVAALTAGGRLVVYGTSVDETVTVNWRTMYRKGLVVMGYTGLLETPAEQVAVFDALLAQMAAGTLRVPIGAVPGLSDAAAAHKLILDRRVEGKIVLDTSR